MPRARSDPRPVIYDPWYTDPRDSPLDPDVESGVAQECPDDSTLESRLPEIRKTHLVFANHISQGFLYRYLDHAFFGPGTSSSR